MREWSEQKAGSSVRRQMHGGEAPGPPLSTVSWTQACLPLWPSTRQRHRPTCCFFRPDLSLQFQGEPGNLLARGPCPSALALARRVTLKVDEGDLAVRARGTT